jgi:hypothetical protein
MKPLSFSAVLLLLGIKNRALAVPASQKTQTVLPIILILPILPAIATTAFSGNPFA